MAKSRSTEQLMCHLITVFAEFERYLILERAALVEQLQKRGKDLTDFLKNLL